MHMQCKLTIKNLSNGMSKRLFSSFDDRVHSAKEIQQLRERVNKSTTHIFETTPMHVFFSFHNNV
jgi:hypothetical protein